MTHVSCAQQSFKIMANEEATTVWNSEMPEPEGNKGKFCCQIPKRYEIATLIFTGCIVQYMLNVCLSVAIVAMVKPSEPTIDLRNSTTGGDYVCPEIHQMYNNSLQVGQFPWDEKMQGHILSAYYFGYVSTQLLGGRLSEMFGSNIVCGPGIFISGIFTILTPAAVRLDYSGLICMRILTGAASGVVLPSFHTLFAKWFPAKERAKISGFVFSATNVGSLLSLGLSGIIAHLGGWSAVFYFFGAVSMIWCVPWTIFTYNSPNEHPRISPEEKIYILSSFETTKHEVSEPVPWCKILTSAPVWAAIGMATGMTWISFTFLTELPTYFKNILHFNIAQSGIISALPYMFTWVSSMFSGWLSQRLQTQRLLTHIGAYRIFNGIAVVGSACSLFLIAYIGCNVNVIVCLLIVTMTARGLYFGGSYVNHVDLAKNYAGTISGIMLTIANASGILSPILTSFFIQGQQTIQKWRYVFCFSIAAAVIPYIIFLLFGSAEEQPWNKPNKTNDKEEYVNEGFSTTHM